MRREASARILYIMIKPPIAVAERIAALPRAWRGRPPELLHMTVQPVLDLMGLPREVWPMAIATVAALCATIEAWSFPIVLNRIAASNRALTLRGRASPAAASLHAAVCAAFACGGKTLPGYRFDPHVTIAYRPDGGQAERIDQIGWDAEALLLVESVVGETRHIEHGRWPLKRQDVLFA